MEFAHLCLLRAGLTLQPLEGLSHCSLPCIHAVCHPLGDCGYMWVELAGGIRGMSRQSHDSLPGSSEAQRWVRDTEQSPWLGFGQWIQGFIQPQLHGFPCVLPASVCLAVPSCFEHCQSPLLKMGCFKPAAAVRLLCWASSLLPAPP